MKRENTLHHAVTTCPRCGSAVTIEGEFVNRFDPDWFTGICPNCECVVREVVEEAE